MYSDAFCKVYNQFGWNYFPEAFAGQLLLWMKEKGVSQYALIKQHKISPGQITRLKRNESVSTHTIDLFCKILKCKVSDIMEYIEETDGTQLRR